MTRPRDAVSRHDLTAIAKRAMIDYGLEPDFPPEARAEAAALDNAPISTTAGVRDLRDRPWISIDNDDSRDLDQLTVAEAAADGAITVLVAVADVAETVRAGSAIDAHARRNTTSVYTAAGVFPMLPERLSTDLTSLNEHEPRLAIVISLTIADDGRIVASDLTRALVLNRAQLTYGSVADWLESGAMPAKIASDTTVADQLRLQDRAGRLLNGARHERGALDLKTPQARPVFDGDLIADLRPDDDNRAKAMIEDFMIAANSVTARWLDARGLPSIRRVLQTPRRWPRIVDLAAALGESLPPEPDAVALQAFLARRREAAPDRFPELSLSIVKLLGSGEYALHRPGDDVEGHFGLSVQNYTHSTAPNRRYPDLVTQRLVKAALAGAAPPFTDDELAGLARHCTVQEDNSAKVERRVQKSAAARLLAAHIGHEFSGTVTGASSKGTWVRIARPAVEGKVVRGAAGMDVGDQVRVRLVSTDVASGYIDFVRA